MPTIKVRNPIARAPILRKGGAHVKSKSSQRTLVKRDIRRKVDEWEGGRSQFKLT
jgi:hypothetical protein